MSYQQKYQMKRILKLILCWLICCQSVGYAQMDEYRFIRKIDGISEQWHKITLSPEIHRKFSTHDLRIYGITAEQDTVEAPYIYKRLARASSHRGYIFKIINKSRNEQGHFFTLEMDKAININQLELNFEQENFDWQLKVEGSQDQKKWYTIKDDYRIVSINTEYTNKDNYLIEPITEHTNFKYTDVNFEEVKYRYFLVQVKTQDKVDLTSAKIKYLRKDKIHYYDYPTKITNKYEDKENKQTIIEVDLGEHVPVAKIKIEVLDDFDYYRPIKFWGLPNTVENVLGGKKKYANIIQTYEYQENADPTTKRTIESNQILNSIDQSEFELHGRTQYLKIFINNHDNKPLTIGKITAQGFFHQLTARFTEEADYHLAYGKYKPIRPNYDIKNFEDKIPENLTALTLGDEVVQYEGKTPETKALFQNKWWLWAVMLLIILMLGGFTLKMMGEKGE